MTDIAGEFEASRPSSAVAHKPAIATPAAMSPQRLFLLCFLGLALLYMVAPLSFTVAGFWRATIFVLAASAAFLTGCAIPQSLSRSHAGGASSATAIPRAEVRRYFYLFLAIATVGVVLRFYDQISVRGLNFAAGLTEARLEANQAAILGLRDAGGVAIVGAIMFAFLVVLPPIVAKWPGYFSRPERFLGFGMMLFLVVDSIVKGGTMTAFFALVYVFFCLANNRTSGKKFGILRYGRFALALFVLLILGGSFFAERVNIMHGNVQRFMMINQTSNFVTFSDAALESVEIPVIGDSLFLIYWFLDYILQPFSEFAYLFQHESVLGAAGGNLQFSVFFKAGEFAGLVENAGEAFFLNPRYGKYQTFLGDAVLDFGVAGALIQLFVCGLFAGWVYKSFQANGLFGVFLLALVQMIILSAFIINPLSGVASYFLVGLGTAWLIVAARLLRTSRA